MRSHVDQLGRECIDGAWMAHVPVGHRRASAALQGVASRIRGYAEGDPELLSLASELEGQALREVGAAMAPARQKAMYSDAAYLRRTRAAAGQALRRP